MLRSVFWHVVLSETSIGRSRKVTGGVLYSCFVIKGSLRQLSVQEMFDPVSS